MKCINSILTLLRKIALLLPFNPRDILRRILVKNLELLIVLDAACGHGGNAIVTRYRNPSVKIIGFDIFPPYVTECKALGVYDNLLVADVRSPPFREKSVDAVYFTETIEHLEKKDGKKALKELEGISRNVVLITAPIGLALRHKEEIKDGNIYQLHLSGWVPSEFMKMGYKVWGRYPCFLKGLAILLFFPPFSVLNLFRLPLGESLNFVALKTFHE